MLQSMRTRTWAAAASAAASAPAAVRSGAILRPAAASLLSPALCPWHSVSALARRSMSSKSPRTRAQQHPSQERKHGAAAAAAAEAIAHAQSPASAFEAADDAAAATAASPSHTVDLTSRLLYAEPASKGTSRHPPPQAPTVVDQSGRAALRTKLHPEGAVVGRGRVVANFGTRMLVQEIPWNEEAAAAAEAAEAAAKAAGRDANADSSEPTEGVRFIALPRGKLGKIVCGDVVLWEWSSNHADSSAFIVEVLPRHTEFRRADKQSKGREEVLLASNFNHMCIVCASQPATNATLLDRYLAAATRMGVGASIIFNKQDLPEARNFDEIFTDYERVGVRVFRTSCAPDRVEGIEELRHHLATVGPGGKSGITIFVGQSGSGKSSLLNTLSPSLQLAVNELSRKQQGRHTTTQTILHQLESGGEIIDSPGFQNYMPSPIPIKEVTQGFAEMVEPAKLCHYGPRCLHVNEPGCAVRLCLRSTKRPELPPPPQHPTSLDASAADAPPTAEAAAAAAGDLGAAPVSPEAAFFAEFKATTDAQLAAGISTELDEHEGAGGDPSDPSDTALGSVRNKAMEGKWRRKEWDAESRRERERELERVAASNARMRRLAEAEAFGEVLNPDEDAAGTPLSQARSHVAERELALTQELAQRGLLDSVSTRRYQSYLLLVEQQKMITKAKFE